MRRKTAVCLAALAALPGLAGSAAADFSYAFSFGAPAEITLNGAAVHADYAVQLTTDEDQVGSMWYQTPQSVIDGFTTTFEFQIRQGPTSQITGDGFAFVLHTSPDGVLALGGGGSELGYGDGFGAGQSRQITRSLAVEFDTFTFGPPSEPAGVHVAIHSKGVDANSGTDNTAQLAVALLTSPDITQGGWHTGTVQYFPPSVVPGGRLEVYIDSTLVLSHAIDLQDINGDDITDVDGKAYAGFTASTGLADSAHVIAAWGFRENTLDCSPPNWHVAGWGGGGGQYNIGYQVLGTRAIDYKWFRYGVEITDDDGGRILGLGTDRLTITNAQYSDFGFYHGSATNACGSTESPRVYLGVCVADTDDGSGTGLADGGVGIEDLLYYLQQFEAGDVRADTDDGNGFGIADGGVGIEDLLYYLSRFESGC